MRRLLVGVVVAGLLAAALLHLGPALGLALSLALPSGERWLAPFGGEPRHEEVRLPGPAGALDASLYRPPAPQGALLLVHGLSRAGRHHPELQRLARLLARRGQLVLVPQFPGLADFRLTGHEVAEVHTALTYLSGLHPEVGVAGLSVGAGPALLAAADVPRLRVVGAFGGYADLRNVVAFVTTGVHRFGGQRHVAQQEEYNRWKVLALLGGLVEDAADRARLREIADRRLANPFDDTRAVEAALGPAGAAVLALIVNRREEAVDRLFAALSPRTREALRRLSPLEHLSRLPGRLLIVHGKGDQSIPYTESLRLAAAAGPHARLILLRSFHHTGPVPAWRLLGPRLLDGWDLVRIAQALLSRS